ncbi:16S rRNA (uracil(1498)-N(3))-methyltransferase [Aquabacterium sp.]|uniref:16S rRNA (uracil(1498)-N(3))-methyltransferase n=1 Tax=Aquabacterium sp. TaxID=1872578 RepID=UPI002C8F7FE4|nr:16S rRNA (uracil(1498)-N(3))-methyltransferase [Aquabacterium sp.]HSW05293.1 16S rRNA (uracil(1498)-N(3))-methyltransferase [Aquabacterium sp.]
MTPRFHVEPALRAGIELPLPDNAARHAQVLRLQPGAPLCLFDGQGGEWSAEVLAMGRKSVQVRVLAHEPVERELDVAVTLALGMPANERMDTLVEKATELGVVAIQPLVCERSVLRVAGERAERKAAHWQAVAVAACEQSGRNRVPLIGAPLPLREWLAGLAPIAPARLLLSLDPQAPPLLRATTPLAQAGGITVLSGPEGGLSDAEQALALRHGFVAVSLGPRVLRADTAPLAALACIGGASA